MIANKPSRAHCVRMWLAALAWLSIVGVSGMAWSGPSGKSPQSPLNPLGLLPEARTMVAETSAMRVEAEAKLVELSAKDAVTGRGAAQRIVQLRAMIDEGQSNARDLSALMEPAGQELDSHFELMRKQCYNLGRAAASSQDGRRFAQKVLTQLQRDTERRNQLIAQCTAALQSDAPESARGIIQKTGIEVTGYSCLFSQTTINAHARALWSPLQQSRQAYRQALSRRAGEALKKRLADENAKLQAVSAALQSLAQIDFPADDDDVSLLQTKLTQLADGWAAASASMVRLETLKALGGDAGPEPVLSEAALTTAVTDCFVSLLESASEHAITLPESVRSDFIAAVRMVALPQWIAMRGRVADPDVLQPIAEQLNRVVSASPELAREIGRHEAATREVLRWRARRTDAWIRHQQTKVDSSADLLASKRPTPRSVRPAVLGQFGNQPVVTAMPNSSGPAPWQASETASRVQGAEAWFAELTPLTPKGTRRISRLQVNGDGVPSYALVASPPMNPAIVDSLQRDLLIDPAWESLPPTVSMAAAAAINDARQGRFRYIRGQVQDAMMEPLLSRLATMPPAAMQLIPLDGAQTAVTELISARRDGLVTRMSYRVDVMASSVATQHAFQPPANSAR